MAGELYIPARFYGSASYTVPATATDMVVLLAQTAVVRVRSLKVWGTATDVNFWELYIARRSTAPSGGTPAALSVSPADTRQPTQTAAALYYTANPTVGTLVGYVATARLILPSVTAAVGAPNSLLLDLDWRDDPIVLRGGGTQSFSLFANGATPTGARISLSLEWEEGEP